MANQSITFYGVTVSRAQHWLPLAVWFSASSLHPSCALISRSFCLNAKSSSELAVFIVCCLIQPKCDTEHFTHSVVRMVALQTNAMPRNTKTALTTFSLRNQIIHALLSWYWRRILPNMNLKENSLFTKRETMTPRKGSLQVMMLSHATWKLEITYPLRSSDATFALWAKWHSKANNAAVNQEENGKPFAHIVNQDPARRTPICKKYLLG